MRRFSAALALTLLTALGLSACGSGDDPARAAAEKFAAGDYMYQCAETQGLPQYIADDAPLENTDIVLWYTVGAHHIVCPEDWPVMPCHYTGFKMKTVGFFDGNPALDVPPSPPKGCHSQH